MRSPVWYYQFVNETNTMDAMDKIKELLATLEAELETVEAQFAELEKRRADLRYTVTGLKSMINTAEKLGVTSSDLEAMRQSRTTAIVDIVKSANGGYMTANEVVERLKERGFSARYDTVVTLLSRLAKKDILKNVPRRGYACPIANKG